MYGGIFDMQLLIVRFCIIRCFVDSSVRRPVPQYVPMLTINYQ